MQQTRTICEAKREVTPATEQKDGLVSVIIPNYNHAQYLGDAVHSVLYQTYRQFEIIIVDDGSTDKSREVIAQFGKKVNYIWQENRGLSAARNTGIRNAAGEYIALLDADDMYEENFMDTMVKTLQNHPEAGGVYCGYQFVDYENKPLPQRECRSITPGVLHSTLLEGNFLVPESILLRRRCYETVGPFDETLTACEDWDMWLKITKKFTVIGTSKILTRHRVLPDSMSSDPQKMVSNRLAVLEKHIGRIDLQSTELSQYKRRAFGRAYLTACIEHLQSKDLQGAYEYLFQMADIEPELLSELETHYELACGDQPKGSRGDYSSLDLIANTRTMMELLRKLFLEDSLYEKLQRINQQTYSKAYQALGLLNYGAENYRESRRYLLKSISIFPFSGFNKMILSTIIKSFLGPEILRAFRQRSEKAIY